MSSIGVTAIDAPAITSHQSVAYIPALPVNNRIALVTVSANGPDERPSECKRDRSPSIVVEYIRDFHYEAHFLLLSHEPHDQHRSDETSRRAEREVVSLMRQETVNPQVLIYLNRLSDLLFVLARVGNNDGKDDVLWVPGKSQKSEPET